LLSNHDSMRAWDKLEHGNLPEENVPTANITMNGGPMGKGVRMQHPKCVIVGIRTISLDPDGNYMGHKND
jgi:hypothetical protein